MEQGWSLVVTERTGAGIDKGERRAPPRVQVRPRDILLCTEDIVAHTDACLL